MQEVGACAILEKSLTKVERVSRCDRCHRLHLKCDRAEPECGSCSLNPYAKCEYLRRVERKRFHRPTHQRQLLKTLNQDNAILGINPGDKFSNFGLLMRLISRSFLIRVMSFLQYPRLNASPKLALFTTNVLTHVTRIRCLTSSTVRETAVLDNLDQYRDILQKAEDNFFSKVNVFLGLFSENDFHSFQRSAILKAAVSLCGLRWCCEEQGFKQAQDFLIIILKSSITPSALPLTLDSLQTLLILMVGMFHSPWFAKRSSFILTIALRIAHAIGLHLSSPCLQTEAERQLARNCLVYHVNYLNLSDVPIFTQLPNLTLPIHDSTFFYALGLNSLNRVHSLFQRTKVIITECNPQPSISKVHCLLEQLEKRLSTTSLKFLTTLYQHLANHPESPKFLHVLVPLFSFYVAYYRFLIHSMCLYRATSTFMPTVYPPPTRKTLMQALDTCKQAVTWALNTRCSYLHWYFYAKLGQCLIFMSRHQKHLSCEEGTLFKRGKDLLKLCPSSPQLDAILGNMRFIKKLEFFDSEFDESS